MAFYCTPEFKSLFESLISKKSYRELEKDIINNFLNKSIQELNSGRLLNQFLEKPFIKKRLNGSGGYRLYYLLIIIEENIYLGYIHPKTGSFGASNMKKEAISECFDNITSEIQNVNLYEIKYKEDKVIFNKSVKIQKPQVVK